VLHRVAQKICKSEKIVFATYPMKIQIEFAIINMIIPLILFSWCGEFDRVSDENRTFRLSTFYHHLETTPRFDAHPPKALPQIILWFLLLLLLCASAATQLLRFCFLYIDCSARHAAHSKLLFACCCLLLIVSAGQRAGPNSFFSFFSSFLARCHVSVSAVFPCRFFLFDIGCLICLLVAPQLINAG